MRIRRYAARLLSAGSATATPSSPPPQPAASWLHAAADDCCAFCELSRSASQEAPDAIKQKGHIGGRAPESEVKGDERVSLAQRPPAPEVKKCKIDNRIPGNKAAVGREHTGGAALVSEAHAEPAVTAGPFADNDAAIDQDGKCRTSPASEAASEPEDKEGDSLANGSATERQVSRGTAVANEVAAELEATELVSLVSKATIGPGVTGGHSSVSESGPELGVIRRTSLVNEVSTGPGLTERVCIVDQAATDPGVAIAVPQVNGTGSLTNEGAVEPDVTGGAYFAHDAAELEVAGDDCTTKAIGEPERTGRASCHGDVDAALGEPRPPDCDLEVGNVLVRNTGETVASTVQPSGYDTADVGDSVNSTSNVPVRAKSQIDEEGTPHDISATPFDSRLFDVVARSIGKSGRTDVICYARRKGKCKMELLEVKAENVELDDGVICDQFDEMQTCESVTSTAGSADVKLADIKRELMDSSAASKVKKMKTNKFECDIDYCRMTFKTRAELSVHKKNTCTVKSCKRHFRSHKYLKRHQSVHNDDMPYKCPWEGCGMAFKLSWDRAEHFQVHTGEKPYKCVTPGCSKIYKFVSDFTRHRRRCKPQR